MVLFENLLKVGDLGQAVNSLARDFRDEHQLHQVHQLGLVVPDVETTAQHLEAQGLGPFFIATGSPAFWRERGQERSIRGKMGLANYQGTVL